MDHISYIDQILEIKQEMLQEIEASTLDIGNTNYSIQKKIKQNFYLAESQGQKFTLQLIQCSDETKEALETEIKKRESLIDMISGLKKTVHSYSEGLILISDYGRKVSLQEYFEYKSDPRIPDTLKLTTNLCVDVIIKGLQEIVSKIAAVERNSMKLSSLAPEDIYIELNEGPIHPIYTTNDVGFELKIDIIGSDPLKTPEFSPLEGLALCVYSALKNKPIDSVDDLTFDDYNDKKMQIHPFALCNVISSLLRKDISAQEILFSPMVSTWIYLFKEYDTIPQMMCFNIDALLAGLYFKNKNCRIKAVLTLVAQEKENLFNILNSRPGKKDNISRVIASLCRYKSWKLIPGILRTAILVLKTLIKPKLYHNAGKLKIYKILQFPEIDLELINIVCSSKTMTAPASISKSRLLLDRTSSSDQYFLNIIPFMGEFTLKFLCECSNLSNYDKLQVLICVPIQYRRKYPDLTFEIIAKNMIKSEKTKFEDFVILALKILRETVIEGKIAQDNNRVSKCFKNEKELNCVVLMVFCTKCKIEMCLTCGSLHPVEHPVEYIHSKASCKKSGDAVVMHKDLFDMKELELTFFDSQGFTNSDNEFSSGSCSEEISITSTEEVKVIFDESRHCILLYFEVKIIDAGTSENISIGIDGIGVFYNGQDGSIRNVEGDLMKNAARFGTGDVIGIGFTSSHFLYYTYNGFNMHLYTQCTDISDIRPLIKLKGKGISVKIITRNFLFSDSPYTNFLPKLSEPSFKIRIGKWIKDSQPDLPKVEEYKTLLDGLIESDPDWFTCKKPEMKKLNPCKDACIIS
ncbi:hypothetical protein SteCoe_28635 [Stentor coeruleus]|uniref:B30.2/SPRY domain-containing protein n=1 Tax=Stentor coeruleus TaxID=5963 RepID=A0A1R2B7V2_9CILI|nr:hypothetical protein SteCoe_28635 [Stentor coeruleus]